LESVEIQSRLDLKLKREKKNRPDKGRKKKDTSDRRKKKSLNEEHGQTSRAGISSN